MHRSALGIAPLVFGLLCAVAEGQGLPSTTTLQGRIVDLDGKPVTGARVDIVGEDALAESAVSAEGGIFALPLRSVKKGVARLEIKITAEGFAECQHFVPVTGARIIRVGALAFEQPAHRLSGRIIDAQGRPVAGARLRWAERGLDEAPRYRGGEVFGPRGWGPYFPSDSAGRFESLNVPEGRYRLFVAKRGWTRGHSEAFVLDRDRELAPIVIKPLEERRFFEGRVVDTRGRGRRLRLRGRVVRDDIGGFEAIETTADGRFRAELATEGSFRIEILDPGFQLAESGGWYRRASNSHDVIVRAVTRAEISLQDEEGGPVPWAYVEARSPDWTRGVANFGNPGLNYAEAGGQQGVVQLELPPKRYSLRITAPGFRRLDLGPYDDGQAPPELLTLERGQAVTGQVLIADQSSAGAEVVVVPVGPPEFRGQVLRGHFNGNPLRARSLGRPPTRSGVDSSGAFTLSVFKPGWYRVGARTGAVSWHWSPPFKHDADGIIALDPIAIEAAATIEGRLLLSEDQESEGRLIGALNEEMACFRFASVDREGRYRFDGLAAGAWQLALLEAPLQSPWAKAKMIRTSFDDPHPKLELEAGQLLRHDLHLQHEGQVIVEGEAPELGDELSYVALMGQSGALWEQDNNPVERRFRFRVSVLGAVQLSLGYKTKGAYNSYIRIPLELERGVNSWTSSISWSSLDVDLGSRKKEFGRRYIRYLWKGEDGVEVEVGGRLDAEGRFRLPRVPCGPGRVVWKDEILAEVDVEDEAGG